MGRRDPEPRSPGPELAWRPWSGRPWCYAGGAVVAVALGLRSDGGALALDGGLAFTVAAAVLGFLAGLDLWYGTPLTADAAGLRLTRGPGVVTSIPWSEIDRIEATTTSRGLLRISSVEIDVDEQLILLSRYRLGTDPDDVVDELRRWPNSPPP